MKKQILFALLLLVCTIAKAQTSPFPEPNIHIYDGNSMMVYAYVSVDGVVIGPDQVVEVAAFCGDDYVNCRGKLQTTIIPSHENPILNGLLLYGNPGDVFNFKLYNYTTETLYEGICIEEVSYVPQGFFGLATDLETMHFVNPTTCTFTNVSGNNWSTAANWEPRIPASCDDAIINGACVADDDATVEFATLTILDGGQFDPNGGEYTATFQKNIAAYTGTKDNYYFIANPTDADFLSTGNLLSGNFDLYFFDQVGVDDPNADEPVTKEWQNYKTYIEDQETWGDFEAEFGGYLYANETATTLEFSGVVNGTDDVTVGAITYESDAEEGFAGFNLVGNPLPCNANVTPYQTTTNITGFYTINSNGSEVISVENPIVAPCSAVFAVTSKTSTANRKKIKFIANMDGSVNTRSTTNLINIEVNNNNNLLDRAYVRFNEQDNLQKFTLNPEATHIYFREGDKDFAIVQGSERMSQLPLYFETREYGEYTINVKLENMNCEYLHLIDNITGADIDLNVTPSYTFRANHSDYASRFRIVFEGTGVEENTTENFVIVEGNRFIIPEVENGSTLTIIDMMGRIVSSQTISGNFDQVMNLANGMYIVKLNDNSQKVIVR